MQQSLAEPTAGVEQLSYEAKATQKALAGYQRKKNRLMKTKRVFDDDKIATLDTLTEKRTGLVASLLGNSKEARSIQRQFRRMVEVPQEDFDIENFKLLTEELQVRVRKPDQIYVQ